MNCDLGNIQIHYNEIGDGHPIVILHGWSMDHTVRMAFMEPIFEGRQGWRRIYPDLPGRGKTKAGDWIKTEEQNLDILLEFIDQVLPGQDFALAGASFGAYFAQGVVFKRAANVTGLLMTIPYHQNNEVKEPLPEHVVLRENPGLLSKYTEEQVEDIRANLVVQRKDILDEYFDVIYPAHDRADLDFLNKLQENPTFSFNPNKLAQPFLKPTLIITGRQDAVSGYHASWRILDDYPRATFVVLDCAGHYAESEQRDLMGFLIGEWLDRVEEEWI